MHAGRLLVLAPGAGIGARQHLGGACKLFTPVGQFLRWQHVASLGLQTLGPDFDRRGPGRQRRRTPVLKLLIKALQVFQQDPPGHAVHRQVMDHQQQALFAIGQGRQHRAQQRTVLQVEAGLGFVAQRLQLGDIVQLRLPQHWLLARQRRELRLPLAVLLGKAQAQGIVVRQHGLQRLLQHVGLQRLQRLEQHRLVPVVTLGDVGVEKSGLQRQQQSAAAGWRLVDASALLAHPRDTGQPLHGLILEQLFGAEADPRLSRAADHLHRDDRVATEFEEVVAQTDPLQLEHVLPDRGDTLFQFALWRDIRVLHLAGVRRRQGLAVELAVGGQRQGVEEQDMRRDHVVRQGRAQRRTQAFAQTRLLVGCRYAVTRHHITDQLLTAGALHCQQHTFAYFRLLQQARLDFTQLDPETTDLHLMVDAPDVFDYPIRAITGQVAGAVQTLTHAAERVGHELLRRQPRAEQIATGDTRARQVQLTGHALRHRLQLAIEDIAAGVAQRSTDIGLAACSAASPGRVGSVFRRAVQVVDMLDARRGIQGIDQPLLQRLASHVDDAHARRNLPGALQGGDRRRHAVDQAHLIACGQFRQLQGVTRQHDRTAAGQGDENLPDRQVEAHRGRSQHPLQVGLAVDLLAPVDQRQHVAVGDGHALGLAGGAGGVDHIGQVVGGGTLRQIILGKGVEPLPLRIDQQHLSLARRQLIDQRRLGQEDPRLAVFKHVGHALGRVIRVQRHIGAARLEHRQQGDDHLAAALHGHADPHFRADAEADQLARQTVGPGVEFGISESAGTGSQGQCLRLRSHLRLDRGRDAALGVIGRIVGVPLHADLLLLGRRQQRQFGDRRRRVGDDAFEQTQPVPGHAFNRGGLEQIAGIHQHGAETIALIVGFQGQVQLRGVVVQLQPLDLQPGQLVNR
ncbi:hypothetical protein D3C80_741100 [compost metagenome]